jgi:hypothetical protein
MFIKGGSNMTGIKLRLVYTQTVPVIFKPPCKWGLFLIVHRAKSGKTNATMKGIHASVGTEIIFFFFFFFFFFYWLLHPTCGF